MTSEIISQVKELAVLGKTKREICKETKLSWSSVYIILTGKKYKSDSRDSKGIKVRGLSDEHKIHLRNIAKNKDVSRNRLLLTYIRQAINNEPERNKIYED